MAASVYQHRSRDNKPEMYCLLLITLFSNIVISSVDCHDMFSPADILSSVDNTCLVLLTEFSSMDTSAVFDDLTTKTFIDESRVRFGLTEVTPFVWPSGQSLSVEPAIRSGQTEIIVFERRIPDRTCLLMRKSPSSLSPIPYSGFVSRESLTDFINSKCNTYMSPNGGLTIEGHHRKEILNTLFSVDQVSDVTVRNLNIMDLHLSDIGTKTSKTRSSSSESMDNGDAQETNSIKMSHGFKTKDEENLQNYKNDPEEDSCQTDQILDESLTYKRYNFDANEVYTNKDIPQCERISEPTKEFFFHEYLKISKPVIIENITKSWPAFQKWTNEYFRKEYGNHDVYIKLTPGGEYEGVEQADLWENFNSFSIPDEVQVQLPHPELVVVRPASLNLKFSEFLDMIENVTRGELKNVSAYLEYSSIPQHLPELEDDIQEMPFIAPGVHKLEHLNIWLSDGNTLGKLHFDPYDNFLCQIHGQKQVILFDPHKNENLYEAHIAEAIFSYNKTTKEFRRSTLVDSTSMVMSPVDIMKPDFEKFPQFASALPLNCTLREGDVLFMPSFWWHEVQSSPNRTAGHNLAVNFWYDPFLTKEFPCPECRLDINPRYRHLL
ncbi:jmjC domain-containing protein E-like [Pecten maximus]|uniref:jmjC domain-containing protein E-like n=1 Tax=Pecten maximus TaxID=6579 RepID=UPI0014580684|nr:jmjC domain-containing protein E-like [Pecten maximus]